MKKGNGVFPYTLNLYGYCWNNPIRYVDLNGREPEVPEFPEFSPFWAPDNEPAPTIPSLSDMLDLTPKEETIPDGMEDLLKPPAFNISPKTEDDNKYNYEEKKDDGFSCVMTVGGGVGIGSNLYMGFAGQGARDTSGNIELQGSASAGMLIGAEAKFCGIVSIYPGMESVTDSEGFSIITGISGGWLGWGGIDLIWAEKGGDFRPVGFSLLFGIGAGGGFHISMTDTIPIGDAVNIFSIAESIRTRLSPIQTDSKE